MQVEIRRRSCEERNADPTSTEGDCLVCWRCVGVFWERCVYNYVTGYVRCSVMTVRWVAGTSLWVGKSLTRPDEVSVLSQAAEVWTLWNVGRVVSALKRDARRSERQLDDSGCCAGRRAELKKSRRHRTAPRSAVIVPCAPCWLFQGSYLAAETDYPGVRCPVYRGTSSPVLPYCGELPRDRAHKFQSIVQFSYWTD